MASVKVVLVSTLLFVFHVSPIWAHPSMHAGDKSALEAVRAAVKNKVWFPAIQCTFLDEPVLDLIPFLCNDGGRVTDVDLNSRKMGGRLAPEIGNLTYLQYLDLSFNEFTGSLPTSISGLTSLWLLDISFNYFTGHITRVNGLPSCPKLQYNCFIGSNAPTNCGPYYQRNATDCILNPPSPPNPSPPPPPRPSLPPSPRVSPPPPRPSPPCPLPPPLIPPPHPINKALGKVVQFQSSKLSTCNDCRLANILDGKIPPTGNFSTSQCTSTEIQVNNRPYVVIDLKKVVPIAYILLFSRSDNQPKAVYDFFNHVEVWVSSLSSYIATASQCEPTSVYMYGVNGTAYPLRRACGLAGRWVLIRTRRNTQLTLCEVEVY